jgi:hypothetical protein
MEEVRRLKIQQRVKLGELGGEALNPEASEKYQSEKFKSALPFMPPIQERTLKDYTAFFVISVVRGCTYIEYKRD